MRKIYNKNYDRNRWVLVRRRGVSHTPTGCRACLRQQRPRLATRATLQPHPNDGRMFELFIVLLFV